MAKPASGSSLDTGHALYTSLANVWAALEGSGSTTADSRNGNTGTLSGTVAWGSDAEGPYLQTTSGTGKLTLNSTRTLSGSWSIAFKVTNSGNDNNGMIAGDASGASYLWERGAVSMHIAPTTGGAAAFVGDTTFTSEQNRLITFDGVDTYKLYVAGTLINTLAGAGSGLSIDRLMSGFSGDVFSLIGLFRYLYVWDGRVLTLTDSQTLDADPYVIFSTAPPGLTAGTLSATGHSSVSVSLSLATNSGGTPPYSSQLQIAPDVAGSPGSWSDTGSPQSGATPSFTVLSLTPSTTYWFRAVVTDDASDTDTSNQLSQATDAVPDAALGFIGDSIWIFATGYATRTVPDIIGLRVAQMGDIRTVTISNSAESGTKTADWQPNVGRYQTAIAAFALADVTHVNIMLGANDASASVSAGTYGTNLGAIAADLVNEGYTVVLHYPPARHDDEGLNVFLSAYQAEIDGIVNGTTILQGDVLAYDWFLDNDQTDDGVHPDDDGCDSLANMQSWAIWDALYNTGGGGAVFPVIGSAVIKGVES